MSRGLGRWQRHLLHELYHESEPASPWRQGGAPSISVGRRFRASESENVAVRRAARSLVRMGLAVGGRCPGSGLSQAVPAPDLMCPQCGYKCSETARIADISEHLPGTT